MKIIEIKEDKEEHPGTAMVTVQWTDGVREVIPINSEINSQLVAKLLKRMDTNRQLEKPASFGDGLRAALGE